MADREDVRIPSGGEQLAAYLYRPAGVAGDVPCVVMAHGFTATRDDALPAYAEAFQEAGFAALVFDYRHFGASTGQPRQLLSIARQREDYRAAVAYARGLDGVDPERIVLWGSSFSGGHVVTLGAEDARLAAVIAQAPFTDGLATVAAVPPKNALLGAVHGVADQLGALAGRPPRTLPAVGAPGTLAAMTAPDAEPGMAAIVAPGSKWRNAFSARTMLTLGLDRPVARARDVAAPLLVLVCDGDLTTPPAAAIRTAERAPRGELKRYPYGHFEIYGDPQAKADQVAFLQRVLTPELAAA